MDWTQAIDRNRAALLAVVAAILALIGGREGGCAVARRVRSAALALLRPAEAAVRRLIVIAARGLAPALRPARPFILSSLSKDAHAALSASGSDRVRAFPLFDRPKRFGRMLVVAEPRGVPRIRAFWVQPAAPVAPPLPAAVALPDPEALVAIGRLRVRVASLQAALADLSRQARRFARWRARRAAVARPCQPLRLGHPPGRIARSERDIDRVLRDCHALAREVLASEALALDTS